MQDPIGDMLTRIRNAAMASLPTVQMPSSKVKVSIAAVLKKEGYIISFDEEKKEQSPKKTLTVTLKYHNGCPVIEGLKRISSPSCRIYCKSDEIPQVKNGLGIVILSTSGGIMSGALARKKKLGGETLCYVW
jgi:small subunit ribosomal protein S8